MENNCVLLLFTMKCAGAARNGRGSNPGRLRLWSPSHRIRRDHVRFAADRSLAIVTLWQDCSWWTGAFHAWIVIIIAVLWWHFDMCSMQMMLNSVTNQLQFRILIRTQISTITFINQTYNAYLKQYTYKKPHP